MFYIESVAGLPKEKLTRVWTHTLSIFGLLAAVVTIVSFFGFRPSNQPEKIKSQPAAEQTKVKPADEESANTGEPSGNATAGEFKFPKPNGIGTIHFDGGFSVGQAMLTTEPVPAGESPSVTLTNSKTGQAEAVKDVMAPIVVDAKHPVALWKKGTRFVRGLRFTASTPHLHLSGSGLPEVDVPTDSDGRLLSNLVWPMDRIFTEIQFAGPIQISGLTLDNGLSIGDAQSQEYGKTLPYRFSVDVPKPGEIMGAAKGDFTYPSPVDSRFVSVQALSKSNDPTATWGATIDGSGDTSVRDPRTDIFGKELAGIRILYSKMKM